MAEKYFKSYLIFIFLTTVSIFIGMRVLGQDSDFLSYSNFYDSLSSGFSYSDTRYELGFVGVSYIFHNIFHANIYVMLFFLAFISLLIKEYLFFKARDAMLMTVIYILSMGLLHEMTQIRVALAVSIVLLSLYYKSNNKFYVSLLSFAISVMFHYSMLFFLIAFLIPNDWLTKNKINIPVIFMYAFATGLLLFFTKDLLLNHITMLKVYASRADEETFNFISVRFIGLSLPLLIGMFTFDQLNAFQKRCFIISFAAFMISVPASFIPTLASRLFELGWVCFYFWVSGINSVYKRHISILSLVAVSLYFAIRNIYLAPIFITQ